MNKKKYKYVLYNDDADEVISETTDADVMVVCLSGLLNDYISFHRIEVDNNGKIVKNMDNMILNEEIIKKLRKASA